MLKIYVYVKEVKYKQVIIIIIRKQGEKMQQSPKKQSQLLPTLSQILKLYHKYLIFSLQSDQLDDNYIYNGRDPREKTRKEEMQLMREKVRLIAKQWTDQPMSNYVNTTMNNFGRDTNFLSTMTSFSGSSNQKSDNKLISRFLSRINQKIKIYVDQYSQYNKQLPTILQDNINLINSIGNLTYLSQFFIKLFGVQDFVNFTVGLQIKGTNIYGQLSHRNDYSNKFQQQSKKQNKIEEKKSETTKTKQLESIRKIDEIDLILELINIVEIDQKDFKRRYYAFYQIFVKRGSNNQVKMLTRDSDKQRIQNQNQQKASAEDKAIYPIQQRTNIVKSINIPNSSYLFTQILDRNKNIAQMIKKYSQKYGKKQKSRHRKQKQRLSVPNITPTAQNDKNRSTSVNTNIVKQDIEIKKISNTLYQGKNDEKTVEQRNKGEKQIQTDSTDKRLGNTNKVRIKNKTVGKKLQINISSINKIGEQQINAMSGQRKTQNIYKNKEKDGGNQTEMDGTKNQNVASNGSLPELKINNRFEYIVEGGFNYNNNFNYYGHNTNAIYSKNKYKNKVDKVQKNTSISINTNININSNINNSNGQSTQKVTTHNQILMQKKKQKLARMSKLPLKNSLLFQHYIANSNNNIQSNQNTIPDINISHINYKKIKQKQRQKSSSVISLPNNIDTLNVLTIDQNQEHNQQNHQQHLNDIYKEYSDHHYITHSNLPDNPSMLRSKLLLDKILNKAQSHSLIDANGVTMALVNKTDQQVQSNSSILYLTKMQLQAARLVQQNQCLSPMNNSHSNSQYKSTKIINHKQKQTKNKKVSYKHELQQRRTKIESMYNKMRPNQFSFVTGGVLKSNKLVHGQGYYHIGEQIQPPSFLMACKSYQKVHTSNQIKNLESKPIEQSEQKNKDKIININILENMGK